MPEVQEQTGISMEEYAKARSAGEVPVEKPAATTQKETVKTAPESAAGTTEEEKPNKGGGFQRRIDKLTKRNTELEEIAREEREARQRLEAKTAGRDPAELSKKATTEQGPRPEPDINDPKYKGETGWDLYFKDVRAWDREQAKLEALKEVDAKTKKDTELSKAQQQEKTIADSFQKKYEAAKAKHEDFEELLSDDDSEAKQIVQGSVIDGFILDPENEGIEVLVHLCKHPGEIARIAALSPQKQIRELGKIEETVISDKENSSPEQKKPTLPAPIRPVATGTAKSAAKPENMNMEDYAKWRTANRAH